MGDQLYISIALFAAIFFNKSGSGFSNLALNVAKSLTPKQNTDVSLIFHIKILKPSVNPFLSISIDSSASAPCEKKRLRHPITGANYSNACPAAETNALHGHLITTLFMEMICKV